MFFVCIHDLPLAKVTAGSNDLFYHTSTDSCDKLTVCAHDMLFACSHVIESLFMADEDVTDV